MDPSGMYTQKRLDAQDVPLMESEKIKGGDSSPPVTYMLNEGCNPVLTTKNHKATEIISMSNVSEEGVEEEEEEEEEELTFLFVMDQEQIWDSLCNPVERETSEQLERGQRYPENWTELSEGGTKFNIQDGRELSLNCRKEELTADDSQTAHQPSFFNSSTLARIPTTPGSVTAGQVQTQVLSAGFPQAPSVYNTFLQTQHEETLRTNTFLTQEESTHECSRLSQDISKCQSGRSQSSKLRSDEGHSLEPETRYEKEKGLSVVIVADEEMSSKMEGTGRIEPNPSTTDQKKVRELKEQREVVKSSANKPNSEFPEGSRISVEGINTTSNGISSLLSSKKVNNHSDMGEKVEDLGQNGFICGELHLQEEEEEEKDRNSLKETKHAKNNRGCGELELAQPSKTAESEPAEMEAVELADAEEDQDWKEMENEMKIEQEKLLFGDDDQEEQEWDMQTQKTSKKGTDKETAAAPFMLGLDTLYSLDNDLTLSDIKENSPLVEAEEMTFPLKELFSLDSSLESACGLSECGAQTSVAKLMPFASPPAEGLNPVSDSTRAQSPVCYDSGQWEYSGIYDQAGSVSSSGQDCEQPTGGGRKSSTEEEGSENSGDGKCVRNVDNGGMAPFCRDLLLTPETQNLNDFQVMDHPVEDDIHISPSVLEAITVAGPLQKDACKRGSDGTADYVVLHEGPDSIQELPKQNLPLPCQPDKVVCGEASVLGSEAVVCSVHKNDISSKDFCEEGQDSVSEILQSILPGRALSNVDEESVKPSLVVKDEQTWDRAPSQPQGHAVHYLNKFQKHLKPSVRNFVFSGKEAEGDMLCKVQETESDHHNTDIPTSPNSDISIAADAAQLTKTVTPVSVSDQTLAAESACSHFSQPSSPMLDCRHSVPPDGDFLAQPPVPNMDPKHPREILEHLPSTSQTCQFVGLKPVSTESSQSASANEPLDQPPASESGFNQHCQLPDVVCHSEQSLSLECSDHQPVPMPILFKKHKHFLFPALNTNQSNQNLPSNQTREAMAPELNTRLLPALATDPKNVPPPTFHSNKPPAPGGNQFAQQQAEATESNLPVHCREANDHIQASVPVASFISQTIPPALESQNFKQVLNTDSEVEGPSLVQLARLERASASRDQKDNIHEASSDLEVNLLGTHSDSVISNNDASAVDATCSMTETTAKATDMHDGTTPSDHISSVESQQMPDAAEVQDSTEPPPLLAFTNPIYFLQLGPPSPPTTRHPRRQQAVFHGSQWQQQQQTDNTKIDAGVTSASVMMQGVAEGTGKIRKGLEKPMVETSPAVVQRKEGLAKHPPLEKSSSCPNKNAIRLDTKEPESNARNKEALLKLRSKSKDWHRQGLRKVSIPTDNTLADAIASLVPSKEEVPAYKEKREHLDQVAWGEKKPTETLENIKRRCSKLINSSELLYQKYSDDALNKAIQSQKRADSVSEDLELGYPSSPRLRRKVLHSQDSYLHRLSVSSSTSLWQDIPMVRGSTMLLSMTHEEQKLQEAKFELIASEASYLRSLNVAVDHFQCSQALQAVLNNQEKQWLFSRLQDVRDVSANFLFDLEEKLEENMFNFNVCDVALRHAPEFRRVYLPYVTNQTYQQQTFRRLLNDVPAFQQVLEKLESDPVCQRLSLKSFLILPFQRITRLKLLVQNILKRTPPGADEEMQATQAYDALEKLIKDCNENVQRMKSTEELIYLSQNMEFECKIFPLISQSRRLIKRGELTALEYNISLKWKLTTRPIYLHLFNDYLLLSRPRENGRFIVFDYAASSDVRGEKCEMKLHGANKNVFRLFLLQNSQGKKVEFLFRTETQSEKLRWISALAPQQAETDLLDDSDAPQVQCVKPYKARENDELALEKADIIMVLQQSTDGWTEGVKLSDGERGWFPSEQVESISCRQARQINLKEQQRVKNAKQQVFRRK